MAKSQIDRLSILHDALLVTILSLLPTHIAARTSALSRCFRHLWEASPSLTLDARHLTAKNFVSMCERVLLRRDPSHPLLSLRLDLSFVPKYASFISSLLDKARSLDLHHLTIDGLWFSKDLHILPIIFSMNSLRFLSIDHYPDTPIFPSKISLTSLRSLSLTLFWTDPTQLNRLLSELCSLEDLHLHMINTPWISLSSLTIRKLKMIIVSDNTKLDNLSLSLPSLESLHLEILGSLQSLSPISTKLPLLRKAVIGFRSLHERDVSVFPQLLNCISHVEELSMHLTESWKEKHPISCFLESGKYVPEFLNLEHLDLTLCFHEHNLQAVTTMLDNFPALKSLKLVHEIPEFTGLAKGRKRKDWSSRLPRNADRNYRYAYFRNLHLEENRKEVIKLLRKKCFSKRQARN